MLADDAYDLGGLLFALALLVMVVTRLGSTSSHREEEIVVFLAGIETGASL